MAQPPITLDPQTPLAVPAGLFQVAGILDLPTHGRNNGAIWVPDTCGPGEVSATPCQAPPYSSFAMDSLEGLAQAWPFVVYASEVTGAFGFGKDELAEAERRVRQRLTLTEQNIVERVLTGNAGMAALFTGAGNIDNYAGKVPGAAPIAGVAGGVLQQIANAGAPAGFFDLTTAADVTTAVSLLEQSAADNYYGPAIIHARPRIAAYAGKNSQFRVIAIPPKSTDTPLTQNQNIWNFGNGYTGAGPTNQAPDATTEYMWATGRVVVWRDPEIATSPPDVLLNRTSNQRGLYAWRTYMVGVECFAACVKVTRG